MKKITIDYEDDKMIFSLNGEPIAFFEAELAIAIFREGIRSRFVEDFTAWNQSQDFIARFDVAHEHFLRDVDKTAKFLGINTARLRRWISQGSDQKLETIKQGGVDSFPELKRKLREELFSDEPEPEQLKVFSPNLKQIQEIAKLTMQKVDPRKIARELKVEYPEYINWLSTKEGNKMLEIETRKIANKNQ